MPLLLILRCLAEPGNLYLCLSVCLSVCVFVCVSVCLSLSPSVSPSLSLCLSLPKKQVGRIHPRWLVSRRPKSVSTC